MNKPFDPTKPVQTRDGRKARIIATDAAAPFSIVAIIYYDELATESILTFKPDGMFLLSGGSDDTDLVNVPVKCRRTVWVNVYEDESYGRESADAATRYRKFGCLACVPVEFEFEEGQGLT